MFAEIPRSVCSLWRARSFTIGSILTFAIGVGVNLAVFAIIDRILFRPLPFRDPNRLVTVFPYDANTGQRYFMFPQRLAVEARTRLNSIEDLAYAGSSDPYFSDETDNAPLRLTDASFNILD